MTNRAALAQKEGGILQKRGNGGPGIHKEREGENGGIRFRHKRVREGRAGWRNVGLRSDK